MDFKVILPSPQLADYVRFFWFSEGDASTEKPFIHHAFAYHCPEIVFCYKGQFNYKSVGNAEKTLVPGIYGHTQTFGRVESNTSFGALGCYLYPHALAQLFSLPASELTNHSADIKTLFRKNGEILEEKIMLASNNDQRLRLLCDFLESHLINVREEFTGICSSIKTISNAYQTISVKQLAANNFLSERQFERRFKEFSGFNPKLFLRIARFNAVLSQPFRNKSLAQIANEYGYYDESHFIHDFQKFSGRNPKEYFNSDIMQASDRGTVVFEP